MSSFAESAQKSFLALGIGTFLFMSFFGVFHMGMAKSVDGKMDACPSMPGVKVCFSTHLEHASYMQALFTNIPQQENSSLTILLSLALITFVSAFWLKKFFLPLVLNNRALQYFYRQRSYSVLRLLQELFSRGILNSRYF